MEQKNLENDLKKVIDECSRCNKSLKKDDDLKLYNKFVTIIKNKYNFDKNFYNWYKKTNYDEVDGFLNLLMIRINVHIGIFF